MTIVNGDHKTTDSAATARNAATQTNGWHDKRRVCIIGSGASGLCAARHMIEHQLDFEYDHYEQTASLGGVWVYTESDQDTDGAGHPLYACMYKNLWTNVPLNVMAFPNYPADGEKKFVPHERVRAYLQNYAKHFRVCDRIKYLHKVEDVRRENDHWTVRVQNLQTNEVITKQYDVVMVCSGVHYTPYIPKLFRDSSFDGKIVHSKYYRRPDDYANQTVLIVGAGPSGMDMSQEIVHHAKKVYFGHLMKSKLDTLDQRIEQINEGVVELNGKIVRFASGRTLDDVDVILLTTGYEYSFSFLHESCGLKIPKKGRIENLFLHYINAIHPTMGVWSIPHRLLPFPMYDQQIELFVKHLLGEIQLPSTKQMLEESEADLKLRLSKGIELKHAHNMVYPDLLWAYEDRMCELGKLRPITQSHRKIFDMLVKIRTEDPADYKSNVFEIASDGSVSYSKQRRRP